MKKTFTIILAAGCLGLLLPGHACATQKGQSLFQEKCATCHALDKQKMGPAVKNMNKDAGFLREAIKDGVEGRNSFSMPAFGEILKPAQIDDLILYISKQQ